MKPSVILFDVNETLLDMSSLKKKVNRVMGSKLGFRIWFELLLHYSLVDNCTNSYHDFAAIAGSTLDMAAKCVGGQIHEKQKKETLSLMRKLPAHPEVKKGLRLLKEKGYRLATLTNSSLQTLTAQLEYAGITNYFEATLSIDTIKKYKPELETYRYAAKTLGVTTDKMLMVAAHGWDIAGAMQAGMQSAFIEREGQSLYSLALKPDYAGKNLIKIADKIINLQ